MIRPGIRARALVAPIVAALIWIDADSAAGQAHSLLVPLGEPIVQQGLRVAAGYLPGPVSIEPPVPLPDGPLVVHLQVEVEAVKGNVYGFDPQDSVPYLRLPFQLVHDGSGRRVEGTLLPMVSRDGFHYGAPVALPAPGVWTLSVEIRAPEGLGRHTDPRSGVAGWWAPFTLTWSFRAPER
jgi:periplasmic iron binding protein